MMTNGTVVERLERQLEYLRDAIAKCVGYRLTGNADADDAQLVDRMSAAVNGLVPTFTVGHWFPGDEDTYVVLMNGRAVGPAHWRMSEAERCAEWLTAAWRELRAEQERGAPDAPLPERPKAQFYSDIVHQVTHEVAGKSAYVDIAIPVRRGINEAIDRFTEACGMNSCGQCGESLSVTTKTRCDECWHK